MRGQNTVGIGPPVLGVWIQVLLPALTLTSGPVTLPVTLAVPEHTTSAPVKPHETVTLEFFSTAGRESSFSVLNGTIRLVLGYIYRFKSITIKFQRWLSGHGEEKSNQSR